MDSLTQITLGAAVGEAVLGRRIGNRAMVWGVIGGTIPDLDVVANFFLNPVPALAFHRGITHSLFFSVTAAGVLAFLVRRLYAGRTHQKRWYKYLVAAINTLLLFAVMTGISWLSGHAWWIVLPAVALSAYLLWRLHLYYISKELENPDVGYRQWYLLFFLALSTHFLLDCFTAFGTQVFQPFSAYRVAFHTIAVVDPVYTVPFLICVIVASTMRRQRSARRLINLAGIGLSSLYLLFTVFNKERVDRVFERALENRNIEVIRYRTSPTIFNNLLWNCVAEGDSVFYVGIYSIFDSNPNLHYLNVIPKGDALVKDIAHLRDYQLLRWFSDGYLIHTQTDSALVISDIRFGGMRDTLTIPRDLVFHFYVKEQPDGSWTFSEKRERPADAGAEFRHLWKRMLGR